MKEQEKKESEEQRTERSCDRGLKASNHLGLAAAPSGAIRDHVLIQHRAAFSTSLPGADQDPEGDPSHWTVDIIDYPLSSPTYMHIRLICETPSTEIPPGSLI